MVCSAVKVRRDTLLEKKDVSENPTVMLGILQERVEQAGEQYMRVKLRRKVREKV